MPATKDGRCWACVQRRRHYPDGETTWTVGDDPRHLLYEGAALCSLPRRERHRDPEVMREYQRRYRQRAGPRVRDPQKRRDQHLRRHYGLTLDEFDAIVVAQGGTCATCPSPPTHVDHDHTTGAVRGVLCGPCNLAIGHAADDPARLDAMAEYLRRQPPAHNAAIGELIDVVTEHRNRATSARTRKA